MAKVRVEVSSSAVFRITNAVKPGVSKDILKRAYRVERAAKRYAPVDQGRLRSSIHVIPGTTLGGVAKAKVEVGVHYASYVIGGTGIYGPSHRPIKPRRPGGRLVFTPKGSGRVVFATQVSGSRPNDFLERALRDAKM